MKYVLLILIVALSMSEQKRFSVIQQQTDIQTTFIFKILVDI